MKEFKFIVTDPSGMHARPTGLFVKECGGIESTVTIKKGDKIADGKKLFAVMGLGVKQNEEIIITVEGTDEEVAATTLEKFCQENL